MTPKIFRSVDEYNSSYPDEVREKLELLRKTIRKAAPGAQETISYNMPAFKKIVSYGAWKNHIGFYVGYSPIKAFKKDLSGFRTSRGTIQFPYNKPLPLMLIRKIIRFRVAENLNL